MPRPHPLSVFRSWSWLFFFLGSAAFWPAAAFGASVDFESPAISARETASLLAVNLVVDDPDCPGQLEISEAAMILRSREVVGGAAPGADFVLIDERIPLGVTGRPPITIGRVLGGLILDDTDFEADETFELTLGLEGGVDAQCLPDDPQMASFDVDLDLGPPATVTITDDEEVSATIDDVDLAEGDAGTTAFTFTVELSQPPAAGHQATLSYATADGSATVGDTDYGAATGTLTFMAGEAVKTLAVDVLGDTRVEGDEEFGVVLEAMTPRVEVSGRGVGTIRNDDFTAVEISIGDAAVEEGDRGARDLLFPVSLSAPSTQSVAVSYATADGSATVAGDDYRSASGLLTFAPGQTQATIAVRVRGDEDLEGDEIFSVVLTAPRNATLGRAEGFGTIRNDDSPPAEPTELETIAGDGQTGTAGELLPGALAVEVRDQNGEPFRGATVVWSVVQGSATLEETETTTNGRGRSRNRVTLGAEAGEVVVEARVEGVGAVSFTLEAQEVQPEMPVEDMTGLDDVERPVAEALNAVCPREDISSNLRSICNGVRSLEGSELRSGLRAIAAEEVSAQATTSLEAQGVQSRNVDARLGELRAGARGVSIAQLSLDFGEARLSGQDLEGLFRRSQGREIDLAKLLHAAQEGVESESPPPAGSVELGGRLGFFLNGTLGSGDRPSAPREPAFDFDVEGVTAGIDYRLGGGWVLGGALGYLSTDADLEPGGGLDVEGWSFTAYGLYARSKYYFQGTLGLGRNEFEFERAIDFPGSPRQIARGNPDGDQLTWSLEGGWDKAWGASSLTAFARLEGTETEVDAYQETGAPGFNLRLGANEAESLTSAIGLQWARASSMTWGILQPALRVSYLHEYDDDVREIVASFVDDPSSRPFAIPTAVPDRDYFNVGVGLSAVFPRGRQAFVFYDRDVDRDDLDLGLWSFGLRFEF